jgi:hypothetical protein
VHFTKDSLVTNRVKILASAMIAGGIASLRLALGRPIFKSYAQDPLCQAVEQGPSRALGL